MNAPGVDRDLYLLANAESGDFAVSQKSTEGADLGYLPTDTLGRGWSQPVTGSVPLVRYYQEAPLLRHRVSLAAIDGWMPEPIRGYVCPK